VLLATYTADRRRAATRPVIMWRALCRGAYRASKTDAEPPLCRAGWNPCTRRTEKPETKYESERF